MMKNKPSVSFIVISYQHEKYIADCLESIVRQTFTDIEFLYLDDASKDRTFQIASAYREKLESRFRRVVYIENNENEGLVKNLNRLIPLCEGKYVKFLAADDFMIGDGIEKSVDFLNAHNEYDMIYSNVVYGNENTHFPFDLSEETETVPIALTAGRSMFELLYEHDFIAAPGVMVKRNVYDRLGLYDEKIGIEDWDFYLRIAREGQIGYLNAYTAVYRILDSSLSHSSLPQRRMNMQKSRLQILEKYRNDILNPDERIERELNDALRDAFHIRSREYLKYLRDYVKRNQVKVHSGNRIRYIMYIMGMIRIGDSWKAKWNSTR